MNKASGGDGIPAELFQILKDDALTVLHLICQEIWKTQQWPQDWIPRKGNIKECSILLISPASKVMLKILQARLQQQVNQELPDVQAGFRKSRGTRDQTTNMCWIRKKAREFQKTSTSALLAMPKPLTAWITENWKIFRDRNIKSSSLPPEKSVCTSRSNSQNQTWNDRLVPNGEKRMSGLYIDTLLI